MADYVLEGPKWGGAAYGSAGGLVTWAVAASVPASFTAILKAAFADWSANANIQFSQVSSTTTAQIDFSVGAIDGLNGILGETDYTSRNQTLTSAAIEFDSGEGWHASGTKIVSTSGVDLFLVALHEIGHALGLDHENAVPAVMNAVLNPTVTDLRSSDLDGIHALYGLPASATATTATAGTPATGAAVTGDATTTPGLASVFRFYDTVTGDHFYTANAAEKAMLQSTVPTLTYEGAAFATPTVPADTSDVFRFYDTVTKTHFFTASTAERDGILKALPSFQYEGVAFQAYADSAADTVTLERFYNTTTHLHHFALPDEAEAMRHGSAGAGWIDEGKGLTVHVATADLFA